MSLDAIKAQLNTEFAALAGINRAPTDKPNVAMSAPDCPAIILDYDDPFLTSEALVNDMERESWHFIGRFLYKPTGLSTTDEIDAELEVFPRLIVTQLRSTLRGSGTWTLLGDLIQFNRGPVNYKSDWYHGFTFSFDIYEDLATTYGV